MGVVSVCLTLAEVMFGLLKLWHPASSVVGVLQREEEEEEKEEKEEKEEVKRRGDETAR